MRTGEQSDPSKQEEYGCDQESTMPGDPHWSGHDLVEVEQDIEILESSCSSVKGYQSVLSMRLPRFATGVGQHEDKSERGIPPAGTMPRDPCGQLPQSTIRQVEMSTGMKSV